MRLDAIILGILLFVSSVMIGGKEASGWGLLCTTIFWILCVAVSYLNGPKPE